MPHFVYSFVIGRHLDCFYFLTVMNNAAKNIYVQGFESSFSIFLGTYLQVEFWGHVVTLCLTF